MKSDPPEGGDDQPWDRQDQPEEGRPAVWRRVEIDFVADRVHRSPLFVNWCPAHASDSASSLPPAPASVHPRLSITCRPDGHPDRRTRFPAELKPADGRFGCGPSKVRPEALARARRARRPDGHLTPPGAGQDLVGRVRAGLAELFSLPDGYEVALGNGGTTAFWDAAAAWLVRERALHLTYGEFSRKFAKVDRRARRSSPTRSWSRPSPATRPTPVADPAADVIAWAHNETSTGVMVEVERPEGAGDAPGPDRRHLRRRRPAGRPRRRPTPTTSRRRRPSAPTAASGWRCSAPPRSTGSRSSTAPADRWQPAFLSLQTALENSRKDQTYNTPALATLLLLADQVEWMLGERRARVVRRRTLATLLGPPLRLGRALRVRDALRRRPGQALARRRHDRLRRRGRRGGAGRGAARQRHRRRRALPQARPQPAADRDVPGGRAGRRRGADRLHRLGVENVDGGRAREGPRQGEDRRRRRRAAARALRRRPRARDGRRASSREQIGELRRDPDPLGDQADAGADRAGRRT